MGFEFIGSMNTPIEPVLTEEILTRIAVLSTIRLLKSQQNELVFDFADQDPAVSAGWDNTLILRSDQIYICFHTGSCDQHEKFVAEVEETLRDVGVDCVLEED
jgi:hypothetical protein